MTRILKLVKNEDEWRKDGITKDPKKESELIGLIENLYRRYKSLHAMYDHLGRDLNTGVHDIEEMKNFPWSPSTSDSEYYSSEETDSNKEDLRVEADQRERELLAIVKEHEVHGNQASVRIKELERQKSDTEVQIQSKATEAKQLKEKNIGLHARILELGFLLKDKGNEVAGLLEKLKDCENYSSLKVADLMAQTSNLKLEANSLRAQNGEMEERMVRERNEALAQVNCFMDKVNVMQLELESLHKQKTEAERQMERKTREISKHLIHIETLKEELDKKTLVEHRMVEEKEGFLLQIKDLELEVHSLRYKNNEMEEQIRNQIHETDQLREEKEGLYARNLELESASTEKGHEASNQFMTLTAQINNLQEDLDSLQTKKSQLELQIEREKQESRQRLIHVESENIELKRKIEDEKRMLGDQKSTIDKISVEYKQAKCWSQKNQSSLQLVERKMEELAKKFHNNFEDNIRLLYQRILVIDQLHTENKDNYRMTKERYEEEIRVLENKAAPHETEFTKMRAIVEAANNALSISDLVVSKFEMDHTNVLNRINKMSNEIHHAKKWVTGKNNEIKALKANADCLVSRLDDKVEQEFLLREKVWNLEAKVNKEVEEKLNLVKTISQLEKKVGKLEKSNEEKDEELLSLGEEKREAIRQLCVLIDYQYSRYDHLKHMMSKMTARGRTRT